MQSPVHAPFMQRLGQAGMLCQRPFASHSCGIRAEHRLAPGLHSPAQAVPMQMNSQVIAGSQVPLSPQDSWTLLAPQRLVFGAQSPPQLPLEQRFGQTGPSTQAPFSSQVWLVRLLVPLQRFVPGLHMPVHSPIPLQTFGQAMASGTHSP
jgi:hypothetical protein